MFSVDRGFPLPWTLASATGTLGSLVLRGER